MKALVLAGGAGTRLRPITHTSAKQLVPVANKPILFYGLEAIRDAGITEVGIIVGDTAEEIMAAVGDGSALGIHATYIRQDAPRGLAHAVLVAHDFLGDEPFVMYLGDNLIIGGISGLVEEFARDLPDAQVLLTQVPDPSQFGVAELGPDGRIARLVEKPKEPAATWPWSASTCSGPKIHEAVRAIAPSARGELEITDAIQWLVDHGLRGPPAHGHRLLEGHRPARGHARHQPQGARELRARRSTARSTRPAGSSAGSSSRRAPRSIRSTVRGPAVIGRNTRIVDTYVGPFTSIYHDCVIEDTEIEHSMVLEHSDDPRRRPDRGLADRPLRRDGAVGRAAPRAPADGR